MTQGTSVVKLQEKTTGCSTYNVETLSHLRVTDTLRTLWEQIEELSVAPALRPGSCFGRDGLSAPGTYGVWPGPGPAENYRDKLRLLGFFAPHSTDIQEEAWHGQEDFPGNVEHKLSLGKWATVVSTSAFLLDTVHISSLLNPQVRFRPLAHFIDAETEVQRGS